MPQLGPPTVLDRAGVLARYAANRRRTRELFDLLDESIYYERPIALRNPVLTASGTFGYGSELAPFFDLEQIGGIVAKSLTLEPRQGNLPPRIAETPSGMLNAIGLENVGVDAFIAEKLPLLAPGVVVVASVFETEIDRYAEVARRLSSVPRLAGLEVNASCPHVKSGGIEFGQNPAVLAALVRAVRRASALPLLVKLSPNVTDIGEMARACEAEGADGLSLINSVQALEVDVERRRPVLANGLGGLSGPAIRPIALRMVWQAAQAVKIPICGIGGIESGEDAVKFLLCGATAVQVGTRNYLDPAAAREVARGLESWGEAHGLARLADLGARLAQSLGGLEAPALRLAATGAFPGLARPRVLWVGAEERDGAGHLGRCRTAVVRALRTDCDRARQGALRRCGVITREQAQVAGVDLGDGAVGREDPSQAQRTDAAAREQERSVGIDDHVARIRAGHERRPQPRRSRPVAPNRSGRGDQRR